MKQKFTWLFVIMLFVVFLVGCGKETTQTNLEASSIKQKAIVVVVDKETKAPVKDAKINIIGGDEEYTTDDMGKTTEFEVDINKGYFKRYGEEVTNRMSCGLINLVVVKEEYGKHFEMDYNIYPGKNMSVVKVEIAKGKKNTTKINYPDIMYIENIVKTYMNMEDGSEKDTDSIKYKINVTDENRKPIEGVKIVVPEYKIASLTDKNGACVLNVPKGQGNQENQPIKKNYDEITIIAYKNGYITNAIIKVHLNNDGKNNNISIKLKKSDKDKVEYKIVEPDPKWINDMLNQFK